MHIRALTEFNLIDSIVLHFVAQHFCSKHYVFICRIVLLMIASIQYFFIQTRLNSFKRNCFANNCHFHLLYRHFQHTFWMHIEECALVRISCQLDHSTNVLDGVSLGRTHECESLICGWAITLTLTIPNPKSTSNYRSDLTLKLAGKRSKYCKLNS